MKEGKRLMKAFLMPASYEALEEPMLANAFVSFL